MNLEIRLADMDDIDILSMNDTHVSAEELKNLIKLNRVYVMFEESKFIGWLRYNMFWDNTPFMNMLYMVDGCRGKGYGKKLMNYWEDDMKKMGYDFVLTSTQADEQGQFFYRKNGYIDVGSLILPSEVTEIILYKKI